MGSAVAPAAGPALVTAGRARSAVLWVGAGAASAAAVTAAVVAARAGLPQAQARVGDAIVVTAVAMVGALILVRRPGNRVGFTMVAGALLWGLSSPVVEVAVRAARGDPGDRLAAGVAAVGFAVRGAGWILLVTVVPLVFPDGRLPSRAWRPALVLAGVVVAGLVAVSLLAPVPPDERLAHVPNPLGVAADPGSPVSALGDLVVMVLLLLFVAVLVAGVAALTLRWRRGDRLVRQQVGWLAAAAVAACLLAVGGAAAGTVAAWMFAAAAAPLPLAVGVAVLQHRLYDLDIVVNRALLAAVLSVSAVAVYAGTVLAAGVLLQGEGGGWLPLVGAAVVAVAVLPLHQVLQRAVNRVTYGAWSDPAPLLAGLGERLALTTDPRSVLPSVTETVAVALRLRYVAVADATGTVLAQRGTPAGPTVEFGLLHQGARVGTLVLERAPGERWRRRDQRLLASLAHQLAPAVSALALASALQRSRERLVQAREEERRRLRRDLHDGLGPVLATLGVRLDVARNTVGGDPEVDRVLLSLRGQVQSAVQDVRRVIDDLRPPALDELGLPGALQQVAHQLQPPGGPRVMVEAAALPPLPAAVEVAAYRIAQEAMTNAVRHSGATMLAVRLAVRDGCLVLEVSDDGRGVAASPNAGTPGDSRVGNGMHTMRERADEIGGRLEMQTGQGRGTTVRAMLPLEASR